jgi:flavin-dependent dehydrogenase
VRRTYPLIAGGGPAGSAAAIVLAQAGVQATLLERTTGASDAICGGFLSWETLKRLEALGLATDWLGGHRVDRLALFCGGRERQVSLPGVAMGLSRRALDAAMLAVAQARGAIVRRGVTIRSAEDGRLMLADGEVVPWDSLFLATGKHDLRGLARPQDRAAPDAELGLRLRLPPNPELSWLLNRRIELHLFDGGYIGLVLQEDGSANACMAVRKSRLARAGGSPGALFAQLADTSPALADRLSGMPPDASFDAIGNLPYGWRARSTARGLFRLGDQAAVIPSLAGEGIGIAVESGIRAARSWLKDGTEGAEGYQRAFARAARRPLAVARMVKALGDRPALLATLAALPGAAALVARLTRIG